MSASTSILIIYTGGTIGMVEEPETGHLKPFDFEHLSAQIPELKQFDYELSSIAFEKPIDSSDMSPEIWVKLASMIEENYSKYDGFVVLHGSDTMAYTASALSYLLEGLAKPVILTGSQLPIGVIRTDGKENIITAVQIAGSKIDGNPLVPDVAIYFEYELYKGNRTTKHNAEHFDAFQSPNYPVLAEAGVHITYNYAMINKPIETQLKVHKELNSNVAILKLFPGISQSTVSGFLNAPNLKGIVLETFGSGNAPSSKWFIEELQQAINKGIIIYNVTQCPAGKVEQGRYETSIALNEIGVVGGSNITTEAAITKLMFLLAQDLETQEIKELLAVPIRGELSV